ncbi:MAG: DUF6754 domain-containing protein [Candidatus Xenobium sp.]
MTFPVGRLLLTLLWMLGWCAALCAPARAGVETWEAGGLRLVGSEDWLSGLDPRDCGVVWSRPLRGAGEMSLLPGNDEVWLAVGLDRLEAFEPATGRLRWRLEDLDLAWGPEVMGPGVLLAERGRDGLNLVCRDLADGKAVWQEPLGMDLVSARDWEGDLLLRLESFPPTPATSKYLRVSSPSPAASPGPERLALLSGQDGSLRWAVALGGSPAAGPWIFGPLALTEQVGPKGSRLVAWNRHSARPVWTLQLEGTLAREPQPLGEALLLEVAAPGEVRMARLEPASGRLTWESRIAGTPALPPVLQDGRLHLFSLEPDPRAPSEEPRLRTRWLTLRFEDGFPLGMPVFLAGAPAQVLQTSVDLLLLQKETSREVDLDSRGRVVRDLKEDRPIFRPVEGHRLYALRGNSAVPLAGNPRDALLENPALAAPAELACEVLLYATRRLPEQKPGQSLRQDFRHPEEPLVLHAFDPATERECWTFTGRLEPGWTCLEGALYVTEAERSPWSGQPVSRLVALDPASGTERWRSPELPGLAAGLEVLPSGLFLLTSRDVACLLDPGTGALRASRDLVPMLNWVKWNNLVGVLLLSGCIAWFLFRARRKALFIRPIAGLAALDEAVGRATEMGRPVLYVPGLADVDDIQTLASLSILGHVARRTAEYDTPILVPNSRSVVMSMAQEVVAEAYTAAGRPESFQLDDICYLSDEQFGFAAGVSGMMLRERPAANFLMGTFFAEALILAETGNATGAIQIAGSASASQLPFFVAACDYTLIGEELYAASAWLSRDPMQVGSLKGQDAAKAAIMVSILAGAVLLSLGLTWIKELLQTS